MIDNKTYTIVNRLIEDAHQKRKRNIVNIISGDISTKPPIKILRGLRGIGKTTALLQLIKLSSEQEKSFYFSADWPQVRASTLYEYTIGLLESGHKFLFIDEIHTYPDWESEIKIIVDQFPEIRVLATGSAPVVFRGDRREKIYEWGPMTFSEYLYLKYNVKLASHEEWKSHDKSTALIAPYYPDIEGWFSEYYKIGGFPFSLEYSYEDNINAIFTVIKQSLEKDAVTILKLSSQKIMAMEKLLYLVATSPPGEMSINSLSKNLGISKINVEEIIQALEQMKLLRMLKPDASGASLVRSEPKILFAHPNLRVSICEKLGIKPEIGSIREELVLFGLEQREYKVYTVKGFKKNPDYVIKKGNMSTVIEIGGAGKGKDQLYGFPDSLLLKGNQLMALSLV